MVLVRFLVEDDERRLKATLGTLEEATERGEQVLVADLVLAELEWVLDAAYEVPRRRILVALQGLVQDGAGLNELPSEWVTGPSTSFPPASR